jgi:hypothetical protein
MITHHVARITNPLQRTIDVADKARISAIAFGSRVASVLPCPPSTRAEALDARSPAATPGPAGRSLRNTKNQRTRAVTTIGLSRSWSSHHACECSREFASGTMMSATGLTIMNVRNHLLEV